MPAGFAPKLAAVLGAPIGHSLSPLIFSVWAGREGVDAYYIPIEVAKDFESFCRACDALRTLGFAGANVTVPHKENALGYATSASAEAKAAGAANMLTFSADGAYAQNSDIVGFQKALESAGVSPAQGRAVVLGAGGAARGVILALRAAGVGSIVVVNRTAERAQMLVDELGGGALSTRPWRDREELLAEADLLVNATSLGMKGAAPLELDLSALPQQAAVADIVYNPLCTSLLRAAADEGRAVVDGLSMLMHQAVPGYKAWIGAKADVDEDLRAALVARLEKRGAS